MSSVHEMDCLGEETVSVSGRSGAQSSVVSIRGCWMRGVQSRGLHGLKTEARTRPVPEIVWPNPTRPERHS